MNRYHQFFIVAVLLVLFSSGITSFGQEKSTEKDLTIMAKELLKTQLDIWEDGEVIVSYVEAPAGYELNKHYHPGEEFGYVLEGSATVWFKDMPEVVLNKGEIAKIPFEAVHTMIPGPDGIKILVFRIHKEGEPLRINVE
jgi:quercetin dioxygenase-like cupin family protein